MQNVGNVVGLEQTTFSFSILSPYVRLSLSSYSYFYFVSHTGGDSALKIFQELEFLIETN
jgi:hypothetical protein